MTPEVIEAFRATFGDDLRTTRGARDAASEDESSFSARLPHAVVRPETVEDVLLAIELCRKHRVPLTARGGGTGLTGAAIPIRGGVVLDMAGMSEVLEIRPVDMTATVQPGVTLKALWDALEPHGLCFPIQMGVAADEVTIGGMVATNASGIYGIKYGAMRDRVRAMVCVTGAGEILRTGRRSPRSSAGYDLTGLLVGSEGTLAVTTSITLALTGKPGATRSSGWSFEGPDGLATAVQTMVREGVDLAAAEMADGPTIAALNTFKDYGMSEHPVLFVEVHGATTAVAEDADARVGAICAAAGGSALGIAGDPWAAHHWLDRAISQLDASALTIRADIAVPLDELAGMLSFAQQQAGHKGVRLFVKGRAAEGALDVRILERPDDIEAWDRASDVAEHIIQQAIDIGGSCSAQHGVGLANRGYMKREHGLAVELMARLKAAFDPDGVLNPGKVLP